MPQMFNALTGPELKKVILDLIDKSLESTGEFKDHITFPWVRYSFEVGITAYPKQAQNDKPGIVVKKEEILGERPEDGIPIIITAFDHGVIDTPDLAREKSKLPIPVTTKAERTGILIDAPPDAPKPSSKVPIKKG